MLTLLFALQITLADEPALLDEIAIRASEPPCSGRLELGAPPCRFFSVLGTQALVTAIEWSRPADSRLVRASDISPRPPGERFWNSPASARSGLVLSGFSSGEFVGIGEFDMRSGR